MALTDTAKTALQGAIANPGPSAEVIAILDSALLTPNANNTKVTGGASAVSAAASIAITTGLTQVNGFSCGQNIGTAPTPITITWTISGGTVTVFFWKATASGDTTLIAASGAWSINWVATGT